MKYLMLMYGAEHSWTDAERKECMTESLRVCDELAAKGKFLDTAPLHSVTTAATVRVRDGRPMITDGPFAETTEQLGGYFLLDLEDLDEAIAVASRLPSIAKGTAEIRPLLAMEGLPPTRPRPGGPFDAGTTPYMLLCYHNEAALNEAGPAAFERAKTEAVVRVGKLNDSGRYLNASPLHPIAMATCVRMRDGKRQITDGPFAETKEVLGGFYLILAGSRDEALKIAAEQPGARLGSIDNRQGRRCLPVQSILSLLLHRASRESCRPRSGVGVRRCLRRTSGTCRRSASTS